MAPLGAWLRCRWLPLLLIGAAMAVHWFELAALLAYRPDAIRDGAWWLLLSAHLAHLDKAHLAMNLLGLALIWELWGRQLGALHGAGICLAGALAVAGGLLLLNPEVIRYVGLSGVLHALMVGGLLLDLPRRPAASLVVLALLLAKLGLEAWQGPLSDGGNGAEVIAEAHWYGALGGLGYIAALRLVTRIRRRGASAPTR